MSRDILTFVQKIITKGSKFEVGSHVRISKYKTIFANNCALCWSEELFVIKKIKDTALRIYIIDNLKDEKQFWKILQNIIAKDKLNKVQD